DGGSTARDGGPTEADDASTVAVVASTRTVKASTVAFNALARTIGASIDPARPLTGAAGAIAAGAVLHAGAATGLARSVIPSSIEAGTFSSSATALLPAVTGSQDLAPLARYQHRVLELRRQRSELRAPLFQRTPRGMRLSEAGAVFLRHAHEILGKVEAAQR